MGCSESKEEILLQDDYRQQLKNPDVLAALESLRIDVRDVGLRLFRIFAAMDVDRSHSIDLDEFHAFFGLARTRLSDQVFSALGHQSSARAVTFDDFVLNTWNFCTMTLDDIREHVFHLYDVDRSGTLDSTECESLFRLLHESSDLPPQLNQIIANVDLNGDSQLSKAKFAALCAKHTILLEPIHSLQARAQTKCLGKSFWQKEMKKRVHILGGQNDVFMLTRRQLLERQQPKCSDRAQNHATAPREPSGNCLETRESPAAESMPKPSERVASRKKDEELEELERWTHEQARLQPLVGQYFSAHTEKHVVESHLRDTLSRNKATSNSPDDVQVLTDLRHRAAICAKRFDEAKLRLAAAWEDEEAVTRNGRHTAVHAMLKGVSAQTLFKQTGKEDTTSAIGTYLQKKLDAATEEVHKPFVERWQKLQNAATLLAERALIASTPPAERLREKRGLDKRGMIRPTPSNSVMRVLPVAPVEETWTEHYDATYQRPYYVSSFGVSSWERPAAYRL